MGEKFRIHKDEVEKHALSNFLDKKDKEKVDHIDVEIFPNVIVMNVYEKETKDLEKEKEKEKKLPEKGIATWQK